jgi:hypothetical protein
MLRSIAPSSTGVASHLCLSSADFITIIAESNFQQQPSIALIDEPPLMLSSERFLTEPVK